MNKYYIKGSVFPPIISFSEQSEHFLSLKCSHMWTCGWATFSAEWNETKQIPWQVMIARGCWGFERYISRLWSKLWSTCCWCLVGRCVKWTKIYCAGMKCKIKYMLVLNLMQAKHFIKGLNLFLEVMVSRLCGLKLEGPPDWFQPTVQIYIWYGDCTLVHMSWVSCTSVKETLVHKYVQVLKQHMPPSFSGP